MRVIITADWHFGYPGRLEDLKWAFYRILDYCEDKNINLVMILGDLTHDREHMDHDVSNAVSDLLNEAKRRDVTIVSFVGNHDMFLRHKWRINAIKPFQKQLVYVDGVSYLDIADRKFWVVPFIEHEPSYMKVIHDINKMASEDDVLLTHIGIASATMNACFLVQNWNAVSFEDTKFSRVYAGHFHCTQKVGSKAWYPGSPLSFRFDEGLVEHGFIDYNIDTNKHKFVDLYDLKKEGAPPDFITVMSEDLNKIINNCKNDHVKVQLTEKDDPEEIQKKLKEAGASKIVFVKPKEDIIHQKDRPEEFSRSKDIFKSWLDFDKPSGLNKRLLIELNKQIRSDTRMEDDQY